MVERDIQPKIKRDANNNAIMCEHLSNQGGILYCSHPNKGVKLPDAVGPLRPDNCPIKNIRSKACEILEELLVD